MTTEIARYTYKLGSRPEGVVLYDDGHGQKLHSFHDSDPCRGQHSSFDVCRIHLFGWLDTDEDQKRDISERPSYKAMCSFAAEQPEVRAGIANEDFEDLDATDWLAIDEPAPLGTPLVTVGEVPRATSRVTDLANARRLSRQFGNQIVSSGDSFYYWTGTHWQRDVNSTNVMRCAAKLSMLIKHELAKEEKTFSERWKDFDPEALEGLRREGKKHPLAKMPSAQEMLHDISQLAELHKWAKASEGKPRIDAAIGLLKGLLTMDRSQFDSDHYLFNCRNATLDLRTGTLRDHSAADYITHCAPTVYDAAAECPRFERFLAEIFNDDLEVVGFVKRWLGYCLTGSVKEQKLVIHVGPGGNGKGTLMDVLKSVVGEYAAAAPPGLLVDRGMERHPTELADLDGRRLVTVTETDDTATLREGLVKQLTGGDPIKARHLFQEFFEFNPTAKFQIFTNHEPAIRGQDFGIWRRILLLHYPVSFGETEEVAAGRAAKLRDVDLAANLKQESPGILRWLVDGAREWLEHGLQAPPSVLAAVEDYRYAQDRIGQFIAERCVRDRDARVPLSPSIDFAIGLYQAYHGWAKASGTQPLGRQKFVAELKRSAPDIREAEWKEGKGEARRTVRGFEGLRLIEEDFGDET